MLAELPETNLPVELWDGEIFAYPTPFVSHQEIVGHLSRNLYYWVKAREFGIVATLPLDMVLTPRIVTQPDVMYIAKQRRHIIKDAIHGPVDMAVEVISTGSRRRDRIDKKDLYEQHGIKEYWVIDPEAQTVEVFFLDGQQYQLIARSRPGNKACSKLLEGFGIDVKEMFTAP